MSLSGHELKEVIDIVDHHNLAALVENEALSFDNLMDVAASIESSDLERAHTLAKFALLLRPNASWAKNEIKLYRQMLDAKTNGFVNINRFTLSVSQSTSNRILRSLVSGAYEESELKIVKNAISHDDVILELGAGIGFLAISISGQCKKYVSYEANPKLLPLIESNRERNNSKFEIHSGVILDKDGEVDFYIAPDYWASSLQKPPGDSEAVQIKSFNKNKVISKIKPTVLIIDIEGGELEFFRQLKFESVKKVIVEIHPKVLSNAALSELYKILLDNNFLMDFKKSIKNVLYWYKENPQEQDRKAFKPFAMLTRAR